MATKALSRRNIEGIGEGSLAGALAMLLQLTGEAVVAFDGAGRVLVANDVARSMLCHGTDVLGADVRGLFPPPERNDADTDFSADELPFPVDGQSGIVTCTGADGTPVTLRVRCDRVHAPGETYLLVAYPLEVIDVAEHEGARAVSDLARANKRLSGALKIVLDTLDSGDVSTLFGRVLEEISETMDADGTVVYLAEPDGFHLRGLSDSLAGAKVPKFMGYGRTLEALTTREASAVRLRVVAPYGDTLRQGKLTVREVVNEDTHEILRVRSNLLPPFTSFVAVPVWFGGHVISIIEVGWKRMRPIPVDDARLLDSVAHYLSVQLVGAFSAMRTQRSEHLISLGSELREQLMAGFGSDDAAEVLRDVLERAADELDAAYVVVEENVHQSLLMADLPLMGEHSLPFSIDDIEEGYRQGSVAVVPVMGGSEVSSFLRDLGEPCIGAIVDMGRLDGVRRACMLLRPDGSEPMDNVEQGFLLRLAEDVHDIARGEEERDQDKRISQALQTGMKNELQHVDGLSAQGIYSSATATALVGGDFYDLIRLPDRRACVIMGDVSGKGVEAASVSAAVKTALGAYAWEGVAPARMVRSLNDFLLGFSRVETFATLFVGIVDLAAGTLTYCSAGHPPAVLVCAATGEVQMLDVQSGVVGAFHDLSYQDGVTRVRKGDVLLLYTDGTTEARDEHGAFFGETGLREMVMREVPRGFDGLLDRLLATLDAFTGRNLDDDVAMVAVRFDEVGRGRSRSSSAKNAKPTA